MFRTFIKTDHRKGPSFVLKGDFFSPSSGPEEVGRPPGLALVLAARPTSAAWKKVASFYLLLLVMANNFETR